MQRAAVSAILPSLLLLSRTRAYPALRNTGALFAAFASLAWIAERALNVPTAIDPVVEIAALYAGQMAAALFLVSLLCWGRKVFRWMPKV